MENENCSNCKELQRKIEELENMLKEAIDIFDDIDGLVKEATKKGLY